MRQPLNSSDVVLQKKSLSSTILDLVFGPQVHVPVLRLQVLVLVHGPQSPRKLSSTPHSANSLLCVIT